MTPAAESASRFTCAGESLVAIVHPGRSDARTGVLIVVGGPQTRVGSHRQFVLLARRLAAAGIPVMRFDYRAMGDSDGNGVDFAGVGDDIRAALDHFQRRQPQIERFVLWGLCDAASASLFYAPTDRRVAGLVLLNPWVRTPASEAQTYVRHYYLQRLRSGDFWKKVLGLRWNPVASARSLLEFSGRILAARSPARGSAPAGGQPLRERMLAGWEAFSGPVLLVLSGQDYVADEFRDLLAADPRWKSLAERGDTRRVELPEANHTFSSQAWRTEVEEQTLSWLDEVVGAGT